MKTVRVSGALLTASQCLGSGALLTLNEHFDFVFCCSFPKKYGVKERDEFYKSVSFSGWGGASGHDAPMIA